MTNLEQVFLRLGALFSARRIGQYSSVQYECSSSELLLAFLLCAATATQADNVVQKPKPEHSQKRGKSAGPEESAPAIELVSVSNSTSKSSDKKAGASPSQTNGGASQQSALDELLARVDHDQTESASHKEEETVRALAHVLLNQVRSLD